MPGRMVDSAVMWRGAEGRRADSLSLLWSTLALTDPYLPTGSSLLGVCPCDADASEQPGPL